MPAIHTRRLSELTAGCSPNVLKSFIARGTSFGRLVAHAFGIGGCQAPADPRPIPTRTQDGKLRARLDSDASHWLGGVGFEVVCKPIRGRTGMRVFCAALIIASIAGAAYAQEDNHIQRYGEKDKEKSQTEINQDKAAARAYQNS